MLIAGNWKMNGLGEALAEACLLADSLAHSPSSARVVICPPATLLWRMAQAIAGSAVQVGGQDCRAEADGAFTGDISPEMLADSGATLVILGHSERRTGYGESDAIIAAKVEGALRAGLEPIVCVGETLTARQAGEAVALVTAQVDACLPASLAAKRFAVAYEPVWAIGTGLTPTNYEIDEVHTAIRNTLIQRFGAAGGETPILYGGSVKPANAVEILHLPNVGGALVGGASLKAADFEAIIRAV